MRAVLGTLSVRLQLTTGAALTRLESTRIYPVSTTEIVLASETATRRRAEISEYSALLQNLKLNLETSTHHALVFSSAKPALTPAQAEVILRVEFASTTEGNPASVST